MKLRIAAALAALLLSVAAQAQTYSLFGPANGVLKGSTATPITTSAASSDVISLWGGSCSSSTYLRGDGTCSSSGILTTPVSATNGGTGEAGTISGIVKAATTSAYVAATNPDVIALWSGTCNSGTYLNGAGTCTTPSGTSSGANPTATIGLTAVNGSAGTFLRSDGSPALSLSIVPTWTGDHIFTGPAGADLTPLTVGGTSYTGVLAFGVSNTSTTATQDTRMNIGAGSSAFSVYVANQSRATAVLTGGPTTPQTDIYTGNSTPLVFGTNAIFGGQLNVGGFIQSQGFAVCTTACNVSGMSIGQTAYIIKGTTTNRASNTTSSADPDLQFTNVPIGTYDAHMVWQALDATTNTQAFRFTMGFTSGGSIIGMCNIGPAIQPATASNFTVWFVGSDTVLPSGTYAVGSNTSNTCDGLITYTNAGTMSFNWAQSTTSANNTSVISGSFFKITRIK